MALPLFVTFETVQATPAGSVSSRTTLTAVSGPLFVTVIEKAAVLTRADRRDVRRLHDGDVGALDGDRGGRLVVAGRAFGLVARGDRHGVRQEAAVAVVGRAADVDDDGLVRGELAKSQVSVLPLI